MNDVNLTTVVDGSGQSAAINANFAIIQSLLKQALLNSTTATNQLSSALDANSQRIINLPAPVNYSDAARYGDVLPIIGTIIPSVLGNAGKVLTTDGLVTYWNNFSPTINVKTQFGAKGDGFTNDTAAINAGIAFLKTLTSGGTLYFPEGQYLVTEIDLTDTTGDFVRGIRLMGAGKYATRISPFSTGTVLLNMLGRNQACVQDLSFYAAAYQPQCAIFLSRSLASPNCNGNKFINVEVSGNYNKAGVVSCGAETSTWTLCKFNNQNGTTYTGYFTCAYNADIGIVPVNGGTIGTVANLSGGSPNTDNRMIACEFYSPYNNSRPLVFSESAAYYMDGCNILGGNVSGTHLVTYRVQASNVFAGPVTWNECHLEVFGTNNVLHYLESNPTGVSYFNSINSIGGYIVSDTGSTALDWDRTQAAAGNLPQLQNCRWTPAGLVSGSAGIAIYTGSFVYCTINWNLSYGGGTVVALSYTQNSDIRANVMRLSQTLTGNYDTYETAVPASGTYCLGQRIRNTSGTIGQPKEWVTTTFGTAGTLTSVTATGTVGTNFVTVSNATNLRDGMFINIAGGTGGPFRVAKIVGTTVYLTANLTSSPVSQAVSYVAPVFTSTGNL